MSALPPRADIPVLGVSTQVPADLDASDIATRDFIRAHLPLTAVPGIPQIRLHRAHPSSGLRRLDDANVSGLNSPFWAFPWPGGIALARHILDRPAAVAHRRVLDLGAGSGLVGIAAAKAGATTVLAAETNRHAVTALGLNAEANGVILSIIADDLMAGPPPDVDLILVGDLFYARDLADRVTLFLDRCRAAGIAVLIGDIGRPFLPAQRLKPIADYPVSEFGESARREKRGNVFAPRARTR